MILSKFLIKFLVFFFVLTAFLTVGKRLLQSDWESKPTSEEMRSESDALTLPSDSRVVSKKSISKLTFIGTIKVAESDSSLRDIEKHFLILSEKSGWNLRKEYDLKNRIRLIFCSGEIAHDIEASPNDGGTTKIRAGSYWFADQKDDRFCRQKGPE